MVEQTKKPPTVEHGAPPRDTGKRLATLPRGQEPHSQEVRVSVDEFKGTRFLRIQIWKRGARDTWWPTPKIVTFRASEISDVLLALQAAERELGGPTLDPKAGRAPSRYYAPRHRG